MTSIGWIDFSPIARNRIKGFLDMIGQGGVVDELGIGTIRDSLSDMLFPGLSTLYTRAKYLFITPYILQDMARDGKKQKLSKDYFDQKEIAANEAIIDFYKEHDKSNAESYFGKISGARLNRQPSVIYWSGICHFKLINTSESLYQILIDKHSLADELLMQISDTGSKETFEEGENFEKRRINVEYDPEWMQILHQQGAKLTKIEAETLQDRITGIDPDSLLTLLLNDDEVWTVYSDANGYGDELSNRFTDFVVKAIRGKMIRNENLRRNLVRAYDLALFLYGQHAVYNLALHIRHNDEPYVDKYREKCENWYSSFRDLMLDANDFNIKTYFLNANVRQFTQNFLQAQQALVFSARKWSDIEDAYVEMVEKQERNNKKRKSRFYKMERDESVNELNNGEWLGLKLIEYRYDSGKSIIKDIRAAL